MDEFSYQRLMKTLESFKQRSGRDPAMRDLTEIGFSEADIKHLVHIRAIAKHQVTSASGSTENRFKIAVDWKQLNKI